MDRLLTPFKLESAVEGDSMQRLARRTELEPSVNRRESRGLVGVGGVLPPVLDACCGSRMFWFDKSDPRALFVDKRRETLMDETDKRPAAIVVDPDMVADFTALPFEDGTFNLVVFDPPHTFCGPNGRTIKKYGTLPLGWRNMLTRGFAECFRVLRPFGTLVFKWNEHRVKLSTVLSLTPESPLFGQKVGNTRTHWIVFLKGGGGAELVGDENRGTNERPRSTTEKSSPTGASLGGRSQ